jgi:hypothetical protein
LGAASWPLIEPIAFDAMGIVKKTATHGGRRMDGLTIFGLFAVTAMLIFYALEQRSAWFVLAFAGACVLGSLYGFLQGAWPFGIVEAIWAGVALRRWMRAS